jgi:hypothetical protein
MTETPQLRVGGLSTTDTVNPTPVTKHQIVGPELNGRIRYDGAALPITMTRDKVTFGCTEIEISVICHLYNKWLAEFSDEPRKITLQ